MPLVTLRREARLTNDRMHAMGEAGTSTTVCQSCGAGSATS